MTAGYQPDELTEHAYLTELAAAIATQQRAEAELLELARRALDDGCRAHIVAEALGTTRSTLYRWIRNAHP